MPFTAKLERFLENAQPTLKLATDLTGSVGDGALEPLQKNLKVSKKTRVLDLPLAIEGELQARLRTFDPSRSVDVFEFVQPEGMEPSDPAGLGLLPGSESQPEKAEPPKDHAYTELFLNAGAGVLFTASAPTLTVLKVSAEAGASAGIQYRLLLPARRTATYAEAFTALLQRARPPHRVALAELGPGELHTLESRFHLRFELSIKGGKAFDFQELVGLFDDISATVKVHAEATLHASLGWSLYEHMQLAVGRVNLSAAASDEKRPWIRLRLQRLRRSQLTLGAKLALQVDYDLGRKGLEAVLDRILELEPVTRVLGALEDLKKLGVHEIDSAEGWEALRKKLDDRLSDLILDYVDVPGFIDELPWEKVQPFVDDIAQLVGAYESLDDKTRSFWESLLGRVDLGAGSKLRVALERLAGIDAIDIDALRNQLLGDEFRGVVSLLEALSGAQLEEFFLDTQARDLAALVAQRAKTALGFLEAVPEKAIERLEDFTQRSGVDGVMKWLGKHATSTSKLKQALESKATGSIRKLITKLTGKAWDALDNQDRERIVEFARRLVRLLEKKEELEERIRGILAKLEGEAGFSVGIEISRLTERAALLDIELDTSNGRIRSIAEKTLHELSARELLESLPDPSPDPDQEDEEVGFRLRDSVFSYRRVRTSAISTLATLFGIDRSRQTIRVDEEVIRVQGSGKGKREASHRAGAVRKLRSSGLARAHELGVWVALDLEGEGTRLASKYKTVTRSGLRIVGSRADGKTTPDELRGLGRMLQDVGFNSASSTARLGELGELGNQLETELSFAVELGEAALHALFAEASEKHFDQDFLNATHRWYREPMIDQISEVDVSRPKLREVLASIVRNPRFSAGWRGGMDLVINDGGQQWPLDIDISVPISRRKSISTIERVPVFTELVSVLQARPRTFEKLKETAAAYSVAQKDAATRLDPSHLRQFGKRVATLFARTPFGGWDSPLFNLWFLLARIARQNRAALTQATGLAQLRSRPSGSTRDWEGPLYWRLQGAQAHDIGAGSVFPFGA